MLTALQVAERSNADLVQEEAAVRLSIARGRPFGDAAWQRRAARRLGLELTLRPRGRPRKHPPQPAVHRSGAGGLQGAGQGVEDQLGRKQQRPRERA